MFFETVLFACLNNFFYQFHDLEKKGHGLLSALFLSIQRNLYSINKTRPWAVADHSKRHFNTCLLRGRHLECETLNTMYEKCKIHKYNISTLGRVILINKIRGNAARLEIHNHSKVQHANTAIFLRIFQRNLYMERQTELLMRFRNNYERDAILELIPMDFSSLNTLGLWFFPLFKFILESGSDCKSVSWNSSISAFLINTH